MPDAVYIIELLLGLLLAAYGFIYLSGRKDDKEKHVSLKSDFEENDIAVEAIKIAVAAISREQESQDERIRTNEIRHQELEKTVDKHRESTVDSTHNIRTLIGTDYVTKAEFLRTIEAINTTMRDGFKNVGADFRQILSDMGLTKK